MKAGHLRPQSALRHLYFMKLMLGALAFLTLWGVASVRAQPGRVCVAPQALLLQPIAVIPEAGLFSYRLQVFNAGSGRRNFSYHFPLQLLTSPAGAVYAFDIRPQQTIIIQLGTTVQRASDATLRSTLRITCHS